MPNALARLKTALQDRGVDPSILGELETEYTELHKKADELETPLIWVRMVRVNGHSPHLVRAALHR